MMKYIVGAWKDLSKRGRAVVVVALLILMAWILSYTMFLDYDWSWLKGFMG
jgi:hypothetical protein